MASDQPLKKEGGGKMVPVDIVSEMKESYIDYAMSVIVARALPDVRDGLKPVHRRILYGMSGLGLLPTAKFRKAALVVGEVLGKYHPHGDVSVYDALVRLAQNFNMLHPLVEGQGNFGSIDGDPPAAMRYTEVRLTPLASELLRDLDKETVNFVPTYDNYHREPAVLPAAFPNLLVNGTLGIAVGMATRIPPHNLGEVLDASVYLIDNPDATSDDIFKLIKGPDFPTGGLVFNEKDIHHVCASGRGGLVVRGEAEIVEQPGAGERGNPKIVISSLPYQVNKSELIVKIAELVRDKKLEGVRDIREESTTLENTRIVLELKSGAYPQKILNALYKHTELETVFHYNMLALVDGVPKLLPLKTVLEEFLIHRAQIVTRRAQFDLGQAIEREHILLGLKRAIDVIDEVIQAIKKSATVDDARVNLMAKFKFTERQADAILEMKLQKLAGLEMKKIVDELKSQQALIKELRALLSDKGKVLAVIKQELGAIKDKYSRPRRTKIVRHGVKEISAEDLIPDKENVLVVTAGGYVKRTDPVEYRLQRRGGKGVIDLDVKEEDFVTIFLSARAHSGLLFFTDKGKVYQTKMYDVLEGKRATRGKSVMNFLSLAAGEKITSVLAVPKETKQKTQALMLVTRQGEAKKVAFSSFEGVRKSGIIAIKLAPPGRGEAAGDGLLAALPVAVGDEVILASSQGQSIRFREKDIRLMGRAAGGVRAMRLKKDDAVVGASVIESEHKSGSFLVLTENGCGKKSKLSSYKVQKRGGSGIKTLKLTKKTGRLINAKVIADEESEIIAISKQGQVLRTELNEIPTLGRQTQGVRIMRLHEGDSLASLTFL